LKKAVSKEEVAMKADRRGTIVSDLLRLATLVYTLLGDTNFGIVNWR
jgi:hypothetical protein